MDAVKAFNSELQSLYETKPPISKAKMTLITRSAMKAIKFYKHVVQSVEKFIQKCKPEYKVPGLYVIDSIVRQSRHQYTPEKDVFAPRFSRNIKATFAQLFNCSQEDKSKIIRVLNLWQKNNVFTADVIQPLLDLAASAASKDTLSTNGVQAKTPPGGHPRTPNSKNSPTKDPAWLTAGRNLPMENNTDSKSATAATPKVKMDKKLFEYDYGEDDDDDRMGSASPIRAQSQTTPANTNTPLPNLESLSSILSNPEVLRQLHTLQQQMAARQQQQEMEEQMRRLQEMKHQEEEFDRHLAQTVPKLPFAAECELQPNLSVGGGKAIPGCVAPTLPSGVVPPSGVAPPIGVPPLPPSGVPLPISGCGTGIISSDVINSSLGANIPPAFLSQIDLPPLMVQPPPVPPPSFTSQPPFPLDLDRPTVDYDERTRQLDLGRNMKDDTSRGSLEEGETINDDSIEVIDLVRSPSNRDSDHRDRRYRGRSRSRDRYHRSRSHSRSRRRRSRSSDRGDRDDREYDRKQRELDREKEKERKKKGLPSPRRSHITVCSTTLWIGHLSKLIHEDQLSNIFGEFGDIVSINLIPPRGCAFVCMNRRQDAMKALQDLKHYKIQSKSISVAWAPGKGMKDKEWKDYWEVDHGASFIPWNKLSPKTNFELLEEGGMLDQDTFPEWLKEAYGSIKKQQEERKAKEEEEAAKIKLEELPPLPSGPQPPPSLPTPAKPVDMTGPPPPQPPPPPQSLPPTPMDMLPLPPFPIQPPGLLGPMGMPMPPGLVGPLGVPPPIMVPQQMLPRMPPPFTSSLTGPPPQSFGIMDGMPPPPLPNHGNLFTTAPPMIPANNINKASNTTSNKDPTEMDVVDENEDELTPKKDDLSLQSLPLPPSPFPGLPPLPTLGSNGREMIEPPPKKPEDTDMRLLESDHPRKRKWGEDDGFRPRNNRWADRDRERRGGSPLERRNDERPPLIPNPPPGMPPDFPPFPNNRHGGRVPDDEDVYPPNMIDFPPRDFQSRDFPRDFPPPRPGANHFFSPRGPMFGPRGPAPGPHSPMNMRPPRHPGHPGNFAGIRGNGDGRGCWGGPLPPPPQQGLPPPPRGARFPLLHPPPPLPANRRMPGERKSRWGEPVEQMVDEMYPNPADDMFPGPPRDLTSAPPMGVPRPDRWPVGRPEDILSCPPPELHLGPPSSNIIEDSPRDESKTPTNPASDITRSPKDIPLDPPSEPVSESNQSVLPSLSQEIPSEPKDVACDSSRNELLDPPPSSETSDPLPEESSSQADKQSNPDLASSGSPTHVPLTPLENTPTISSQNVPSKLPEDIFADPIGPSEDLFLSPSKDIFSNSDEKIEHSVPQNSPPVSDVPQVLEEDQPPGVSLYSPEPAVNDEFHSDNINESTGLPQDIPHLIPVTGVDLQPDMLEVEAALTPCQDVEPLPSTEQSNNSEIHPST